MIQNFNDFLNETNDDGVRGLSHYEIREKIKMILSNIEPSNTGDEVDIVKRKYKYFEINHLFQDNIGYWRKIFYIIEYKNGYKIYMSGGYMYKEDVPNTPTTSENLDTLMFGDTKSLYDYLLTKYEYLVSGDDMGLI